MCVVPTITRTQRREDERRKLLRQKGAAGAFAVGLQILPQVPAVPLEPWGFIFIAISISMLVWIFLTAESVQRIGVYEKATGVWCIILWCGVAGWILLPAKWMEQKANSLEGDLWLANAHATRNALQIGNSIDMFDANVKGQPFLNLFQDAGLEVANNDGHLSLSTFVRDQNGKWIVHIENNHWTINPEKSISMDHNYTTDTLEVKDGRGHVVLQVRLYPDRISLQGEWFDDQGHGRQITSGKNGSIDIYLINFPSQPKPGEVLIKPLFKYPSKIHWAEWNQ
jgi:hypothetical protein